MWSVTSHLPVLMNTVDRTAHDCVKNGFLLVSVNSQLMSQQCHSCLEFTCLISA